MDKGQRIIDQEDKTLHDSRSGVQHCVRGADPLDLEHTAASGRTLPLVPRRDGGPVERRRRCRCHKPFLSNVEGHGRELWLPVLGAQWHARVLRLRLLEVERGGLELLAGHGSVAIVSVRGIIDVSVVLGVRVEREGELRRLDLLLGIRCMRDAVVLLASVQVLRHRILLLLGIRKLQHREILVLSV